MNNEEKEIDLRDYIRVLLKRKWIIVISALVCGGAAAIFSLLLPNVYEANSVILIMPPKYKAELSPRTFSPYTYGALLKADDLLKALIDNLKLESEDDPMEVEALSKMLRTEIVKETLPETVGDREPAGSPLINLYVRSLEPEKAIGIANAWMELFVKKNSDISSYTTAESYRFIMEQYKISKENLAQAEERIKKFQNRWQIDLMERELEVKKGKFINYESELYTTEASLENVQDQLKGLKDAIAKEDRFLVLSKAITDDALWEQMTREKTGTGSSSFSDSKLRSEEINPIYQNLQQRIADAEIQLGVLRPKLVYLQEKIKETKKGINTLQRTINEAGLGLTRLERMRTTYQSTYSKFAKLAEDARIAKAEQSVDVKIVARAVAARKVSPQRKGNVGIAGIVGLFVGILGAFGVEYLKEEKA